MDIFSIIIIAIGLAMDCFAVSVSKGVCARRYYFKQTLLMAFLFGLFQGVMPLIGYYAGISFAETFAAIDHWIAFGLLGIIGGKMIWESLTAKNEACEQTDAPAEQSNINFKLPHLLSLAVATSIDALATGIILVPFPKFIWIAVSIIGLVSFLLTFLGMWIGVTFGKRFRLNANLLGGIILILIGTKILIEHLWL